MNRTANQPYQSSLALGTLCLLAWRNLWRHKRRTFITLFSIAIGFGLSVFSIGLQDSAHNSMVKNAIKMGDGHITIQHHEYLDSPANYRFIEQGEALVDKLSSLSLPAEIIPRVSLQALASTANNSVGIQLQGISINNDPLKKLLNDSIIEGQWDITKYEQGLIIGEGMAKKLKVSIGSKIILMAGKQGGESESHLGRVRGIFKSGIDELDKYLVISTLSFAQRFLYAEGASPNYFPITKIAVFIDDNKQLEAIHTQITSEVLFDNISILTWQEVMPQLVQYIIVDDIGSYIMQIFILFIILFSIVNTILMSVLERTREFGLLRALGLNKSYLIILVLIETFFLSSLSVIFGWLLGGGIHWYVASYGIDFSNLIPEGTTFAGTFMDTIIYSELSSKRVFQLTSIVFFTTLTLGIYPALKAARIQPIEALRT